MDTSRYAHDTMGSPICDDFQLRLRDEAGLLELACGRELGGRLSQAKLNPCRLLVYACRALCSLVFLFIIIARLYHPASTLQFHVTSKQLQSLFENTNIVALPLYIRVGQSKILKPWTTQSFAKVEQIRGLKNVHTNVRPFVGREEAYSCTFITPHFLNICSWMMN